MSLYAASIDFFEAQLLLLLLSRFSHVWLCDPIDGSPVPGILQATTLEWLAISFSNAWKWKVKVKSLSRVRLLATSWTAAYQAPPSMGFSRQEYWSGVPLPSLNDTLHITNNYFKTFFPMAHFYGKIISSDSELSPGPSKYTPRALHHCAMKDYSFLLKYAWHRIYNFNHI